MLRLQNSCSPALPFPRKSIHAPLAVMRDGREEGDREWMEVKSFHDVVNQIGPFAMLVDPIERVARGPHR